MSFVAEAFPQPAPKTVWGLQDGRAVCQRHEGGVAALGRGVDRQGALGREAVEVARATRLVPGAREPSPPRGRGQAFDTATCPPNEP